MRLRCAVCGLPTELPFVLQRVRMCVHCYIHEQIRLDRAWLAKAVVFCRENLICAYCGEASTDVEHVIARAHGLPTWTVVACRDCNTIAGPRLFFTFVEKREYIHSVLAQRHRKLLRMPEWTRDEIEEMGAALRVSVRVHAQAREIVTQRLRFRLEELAGGL
jgi:NMD protein affecting ribosome stability and mRNA decay